jgi:hypothetical protein
MPPFSRAVSRLASNKILLTARRHCYLLCGGSPWGQSIWVDGDQAAGRNVVKLRGDGRQLGSGKVDLDVVIGAGDDAAHLEGRAVEVYESAAGHINGVYLNYRNWFGIVTAESR